MYAEQPQGRESRDTMEGEKGTAKGESQRVSAIGRPVITRDVAKKLDRGWNKGKGDETLRTKVEHPLPTKQTTDKKSVERLKGGNKPDQRYDGHHKGEKKGIGGMEFWGK